MRAVVTVTLLLLLSSSVSLVLGRGSDDVMAFFASKGIKQRAFAPDAHACATCTTIVNTLTDIAANATLANKTEAVLTAACDFIISLDPTLKPLEGLCSVLPDFIINLADYGINNGANGSSIVCADVLGLCVQPCCITPRAPEQVHLSFATSATTGRNASVRVSWVTLLPPANGTESKVNWRNPALVPWNTADATLSTYTLGGWQGTLHTAILEGLAPDSVYEYFVGAANDDFSAVMQFRTLPEAIGTPDRPVRWVGVTDMGFESQSNATRARIQQLVNTSAIDFVVHPGDVGYADGDQTWWDRWFREMQPVASRVPYMVGLGNHEIIWWNATAYKHRYLTPPAGLGSPSDALWYSMVSGPVTIIVLDVEAQNDTPFLGDDQLQWLQQTLEESEAAGRMTIVNLHRPLYCSSYSIQDCTTHSFYLRGRLEDTLRKYHVSAVMNGHVHNYERTWPVFNGTVVQKSYDNAGVPVYLVNGGAGNQEGQAAFYTNNNTWSAVRTVDRAFMTFQAWRDGSSSSSSFAPIYLNATLIRSSDGAILDSILVTRRFD